MTTEELRQSLLRNPKNGYTQLSSQQREEMEAYCKRHMAFMDAYHLDRCYLRSSRLQGSQARHGAEPRRQGLLQ